VALSILVANCGLIAGEMQIECMVDQGPGPLSEWFLTSGEDAGMSHHCGSLYVMS
jgi:hypothetical protein